MNKHIVARLYHEAMDKCSSGKPWEFEMHFAELIVQECTKVCAPIPGLPFSAEIDSARYGCAKDINKHFGVE